MVLWRLSWVVGFLYFVAELLSFLGHHHQTMKKTLLNPRRRHLQSFSLEEVCSVSGGVLVSLLELDLISYGELLSFLAHHLCAQDEMCGNVG